MLDGIKRKLGLDKESQLDGLVSEFEKLHPRFRDYLDQAQGESVFDKTIFALKQSAADMKDSQAHATTPDLTGRFGIAASYLEQLSSSESQQQLTRIYKDLRSQLVFRK